MCVRDMPLCDTRNQVPYYSIRVKTDENKNPTSQNYPLGLMSNKSFSKGLNRELTVNKMYYGMTHCQSQEWLFFPTLALASRVLIVGHFERSKEVRFYTVS